MTLYRIDNNVDWDEDGSMLYDTEKDVVLVPVEPCEHGKIDRHDTEYDPIKDRTLDGHLCPGAGVGEETQNDCPIEREHECKRPCF